MAGEIDARVEVPGLARLVRTMRQAGVEVSDLKEANKRAGEIVADRGRGNVPVDTGRLRGSIRAAQQVRRARVQAGRAGIRYARFAEFGSAKIRAYRYLYGSAQETQPAWLAAYEGDLNRILNKIQGD